MAETTLEREKPSQSEAFAESVLARVLREFQQQEKADPHTADRGLLDEGRAALVRVLEQDGPLDVETVRDGFILLWRRRDWPLLASLLMRYLAQPLSDSETAWAYVHLANAIVMSGSAAGAVLAHEAFERWLPGKSPRLSANWPYYPVPEDTSGPVYAGEEVRLLSLAQSGEFATSYLAVWRNNDYLAKIDTALSEIPLTPTNRKQRFYVLRMATCACESAGDLDRSQSYVRRMYVLAAGAEDASQKAELHSKALGHAMGLARLRKDEAEFNALAGEIAVLLNGVEQ